MDLTQSVLSCIEANAGRLSAIAKDIWSHPEVALQEFYACDLLAGELERHGFAVQSGVGDMPTAFVATWGSGRPIIGILAEYDALPGLSQTVATAQQPVQAGGPGHGCGHNLFGAASVGAALAVKAALSEGGLSGTVRLYGCPAEETLMGKVYMARGWRVPRSGRGASLASRRVEFRRRPGLEPGAQLLQGKLLRCGDARGGLAAHGPQRAGCGYADGHRRQLPTRARGAGHAYPQRDHERRPRCPTSCLPTPRSGIT